MLFLNVRAFRKIQESNEQKLFAKPTRLQFPLCLVNFGLVCLVLGPVEPQGPLGRRFMMSLFSTANEGQEFDLHMNNRQKKPLNL